MKLLILFPNVANWAAISTAVPILAGIAKHKNWEIEYFDTYSYQNEEFISREREKEKNAGFKLGASNIIENTVVKYFRDIVPDLQNKIDTYKPDLIAITSLSPDYAFLLSFFYEIKYPVETKVIIGGVHTTFKPDEVINTGLFDLAVIGEGEETFKEILDKIEKKNNIDNILGTYFYNKQTKEIIKNPKRMLLSAEKLWEIERDHSFFKDEAYFLRPFDGKQIPRYEMEISRGCPFNCAYCGNSVLKNFNRGLGKYVKVRPIYSSIKQMKELVEKFKIGIFSFQDECFLSHPTSWLKEFMDQYKLHINKPYIFMSRPETITEEKIKLILSYNIPFQASIGVESGSENILQMCDRTCTQDKVIKAFKILNKHRIRTNTFFMIGFPFETREDTFKSIMLCKKIKPSVSVISIFQPYPGIELTDLCIEKGFISNYEISGTFTSDSILNMPPPYLSKKEIRNLSRVFILYSILPKKYWKDIEKCEKDYENNKDLFERLLKIRWENYNLADKKKDIKLV